MTLTGGIYLQSKHRYDPVSLRSGIAKDLFVLPVSYRVVSCKDMGISYPLVTMARITEARYSFLVRKLVAVSFRV